MDFCCWSRSPTGEKPVEPQRPPFAGLRDGPDAQGSAFPAPNADDAKVLAAGRPDGICAAIVELGERGELAGLQRFAPAPSAAPHATSAPAAPPVDPSPSAAAPAATCPAPPAPAVASPVPVVASVACTAVVADLPPSAVAPVPAPASVSGGRACGRAGSRAGRIASCNADGCHCTRRGGSCTDTSSHYTSHCCRTGCARCSCSGRGRCIHADAADAGSCGRIGSRLRPGSELAGALCRCRGWAAGRFCGCSCWRRHGHASCSIAHGG